MAGAAGMAHVPACETALNAPIQMAAGCRHTAASAAKALVGAVAPVQAMAMAQGDPAVGFSVMDQAASPTMTSNPTAPTRAKIPARIVLGRAVPKQGDDRN